MIAVWMLLGMIIDSISIIILTVPIFAPIAVSLGLDERFAAHASYEALADIVRARFTAPAETLAELFTRMTFNILVGNTDDHARNHAAFWDGESLTLTPAYDICPQSRTGREAS